MAQAELPTLPQRTCPAYIETERKDNWWTGPLATVAVLGAFGVYATARAIMGCFSDLYYYGIETPYFADTHAHVLSPFYSPLIILPNIIPSWVSPAFLILWAPGGFRLTCYYYRKAYYRAFFMDPPACSVGEPANFCTFKRGNKYEGETRLWLFQNLHRYFLYFALIFLVLLAIDVIRSLIFPTANGGITIGASVGTLVLAANVTLLGLYTFSCHSLRHLVGGGVNSFSQSPVGRFRYKLWTWASILNKNHMAFAWASLFMVGFADFYVWMVAAGNITDYYFKF